MPDWSSAPCSATKCEIHDERSRAYAHQPPERTILTAVQHQRRVPIYDQGATGSCTGGVTSG